MSTALHPIKSTFAFEGTTCAATLSLPTPDAAPGSLPAVLIVHGWGGVQDAMTTPFVRHFLEAGFAVMEFDYPGWGASGGWPRQTINPWQRVRTADAALSHLKAQAQVDAYQVVLWGTSFGGGHVVDLASQHPELMGAIAQVPMLDGLAATMAVPFWRRLQFFACGLIDLVKPGHPVCIPTLAPPGEFGSMDRDGAYAFLKRGTTERGLPYDNRVAARSLLTMAFYRPIRRLRDLRVPTLLVGATNDTVAPFVAKAVRKHAPACVQTTLVQANHFEPYFEPVFPEVIAAQLRFLKALPRHGAKL